MVSTNNIVEIEADSARNGYLQFQPADCRVRGKMDLLRVPEPKAKMLTDLWPNPIPGQRLRFNLETGEASLIEPLRFEENQVTRERLTKAGYQIAPEVQKFDNAHPATWLYWMKRAVETGYARLTAGQFPAKLPGKPENKSFFAQPEGTQQSLAAAIGELSATVKAQTQLLAALVDRIAPSPPGK